METAPKLEGRVTSILLVNEQAQAKYIWVLQYFIKYTMFCASYYFSIPALTELIISLKNQN